MPPTSEDAARRLLILVGLSSHGLRLMMVWDFVFRTWSAFRDMSGQAPAWRSLGLRGEWLKVRAKWNWFWERRAIREAFRTAGLSGYLTSAEETFLGLGLSESSRAKACKLLWQIEAAACIGWALGVLPRLWPMDQSFDGKLDFASLADPDRRLVENASLRPLEEIQAEAERVRCWHWRARQLQLQREGYPWLPANATSEQIADLQSKGLGTLDGLVRATAQLPHKEGKLGETMEEDFVAKGKPYRQLTRTICRSCLGSQRSATAR